MALITAPNLILLTVECWRADHFSRLTPRLMELAEESIFFSEAQTAGGWTKISMTALMSSAYASMHGGPELALETPARRTLAETLLENGYWTGGFTANPVCGMAGGFYRGFTVFREARRKTSLPPDAPDWKTGWRRLFEMGIAPRETQMFVDARGLTDFGLNWLADRKHGEPHFLWLHYLDPHWPCQMGPQPSTPGELADAWHDVDVFHNRVLPSRGTFDPGAAARSRWAARYCEALSATDTEIGRLLVELRRRTDWDRTIVAVTGDHGEELYERGTWHHSWNQMYKEGIHVPLILRVPGVNPARVNQPVGLIDLAPTLLDFVGLTAPAQMIGRSFRPVIAGDAGHGRPVFTEMTGHNESAAYRLAIRDGDWKYIYDFEDPHNSRLFNLAEDPAEQVNLRERYYATVFRRFEQMRLAHVALGLAKRLKRLPPHLSDAHGQNEPIQRLSDDAGDGLLREQLEALGYL